MKLQAKSAHELNEALQKSAKCINSKNTQRILEHVLLVQRDNKSFQFISSTGDAQLTIPAPLNLIDGRFDKPITLPVRLISQLLGTLPDCTVTMDFSNDGILTLYYVTEVKSNKQSKAKEGSMSATFEDGELFPLLAQPNEILSRIVFPFERFNDIVNRSADFVSRDEFRPQMCCLCMDVSEDRSRINFVGCDGNALIRTSYSNDPKTGGTEFFREGKPGVMLLPRQYFRILPVFEGCEDIQIETDGRMHRFTSGECELLCKNIEGRYPNYQSIIPNGQPFHITFDKKEMLNIIKRVSLCSNKQAQVVKFTYNGMFIDVEARDTDLALTANDQVLVIDAESPERFSVPFSIPRFLTALQAVSTDEASIYFSDAQHAVILRSPAPDADVIALCMPVVTM